MLHNLPCLHQPPDCFHRPAPAAHQLAPACALLPAGGPEGVGRPLPLQRGLRIHLPILCDRRNQPTRKEVPGANLIQRHGQVGPVRPLLLRDEGPLHQ